MHTVLRSVGTVSGRSRSAHSDCGGRVSTRLTRTMRAWPPPSRPGERGAGDCRDAPGGATNVAAISTRKRPHPRRRRDNHLPPLKEHHARQIPVLLRRRSQHPSRDKHHGVSPYLGLFSSRPRTTAPPEPNWLATAYARQAHHIRRASDRYRQLRKIANTTTFSSGPPPPLAQAVASGFSTPEQRNLLYWNTLATPRPSSRATSASSLQIF